MEIGMKKKLLVKRFILTWVVVAFLFDYFWVVFCIGLMFGKEISLYVLIVTLGLCLFSMLKLSHALSENI